jgi:hypothetical protein
MIRPQPSRAVTSERGWRNAGGGLTEQLRENRSRSSWRCVLVLYLRAVPSASPAPDLAQCSGPVAPLDRRLRDVIHTDGGRSFIKTPRRRSAPSIRRAANSTASLINPRAERQLPTDSPDEAFTITYGFRRGWDSNPVSPCRICNVQIPSCQDCQECQRCRGTLLDFTRWQCC